MIRLFEINKYRIGCLILPLTLANLIIKDPTQIIQKKIQESTDTMENFTLFFLIMRTAESNGDLFKSLFLLQVFQELYVCKMRYKLETKISSLYSGKNNSYLNDVTILWLNFKYETSFYCFWQYKHLEQPVWRLKHSGVFRLAGKFQSKSAPSVFLLPPSEDRS